MSKRKDVQNTYREGRSVRWIAETAWELGRIAGIEEQVRRGWRQRLRGLTSFVIKRDGFAHARKLKEGLK